MALKEISFANRGRAAWVVAAVVFLLAAGGWMLSRATDGPALTVGVPAASAPRVPEARIGGPVTALAFDAQAQQLAVAREDATVFVLAVPAQP